MYVLTILILPYSLPKISTSKRCGIRSQTRPNAGALPMGCGVVFEVPCFADTLIECSSDKRIIIDLTLSTDQIHSFSAFQSKYLRSKVMAFTHLAKIYSTSFRPCIQLPSLLTHHNLCRFLTLSLPVHRSSGLFFILKN